jgi:hypothetical protein
MHKVVPKHRGCMSDLFHAFPERTMFCQSAEQCTVWTIVVWVAVVLGSSEHACVHAANTSNGLVLLMYATVVTSH